LDKLYIVLQKIDAAKEYYQRKVDFLTQQMEKLQSVLREKFEMKEGMTWYCEMTSLSEQCNIFLDCGFVVLSILCHKRNFVDNMSQFFTG